MGLLHSAALLCVLVIIASRLNLGHSIGDTTGDDLIISLSASLLMAAASFVVVHDQQAQLIHAQLFEHDGTQPQLFSIGQEARERLPQGGRGGARGARLKARRRRYNSAGLSDILVCPPGEKSPWETDFLDVNIGDSAHLSHKRFRSKFRIPPAMFDKIVRDAKASGILNKSNRGTPIRLELKVCITDTCINYCIAQLHATSYYHYVACVQWCATQV
jgi:hypothetical protein